MIKQHIGMNEVEPDMDQTKGSMVALLKPFLGFPNPSLILEMIFGRREGAVIQAHFTDESSSLDAVMANLNRPNTANTIRLLK